MKDKIIPGKLLQPNMKVRRMVCDKPTGPETKVIDSIYFKNPVYFKKNFLVVAENCDELQQAIQDAIREDRKQTIVGLNNLEMPGVSSPELRGYNAGLKQAQDYMRALNEIEG